MLLDVPIVPLTTTVSSVPTAVGGSLVQVTVVAGPSVEIQVRMNQLSDIRVKVIAPDSETTPVAMDK